MNRVSECGMQTHSKNNIHILLRGTTKCSQTLMVIIASVKFKVYKNGGAPKTARLAEKA